MLRPPPGMSRDEAGPDMMQDWRTLQMSFFEVVGHIRREDLSFVDMGSAKSWPVSNEGGTEQRSRL